MTTLSLTNPVPNTLADANVIASNNAAIIAVINGSIDNSNVASAAGIAYSKLALTGSVVNADIAAAAAIAASKLSLTDLAQSQSTPADPTGTTSATTKMMGLAGAITPAVTGRVRITIDGYIGVTAVPNVVGFRMQTGTGTAPTNGAALTGTTRGSSPSTQGSATTDRMPFSLTRIVTGLTLATAIWIDIGLDTTGGTASLHNLTIIAQEF